MDIQPGQELGRYPHLFPPPGFTQFHRNGLVTLPAVSGVTTLLEKIQITSNQTGWLRLIGLEAGDWNDLFFTISVGGNPFPDYVRIQVPLGNTATPVPVFVPIQVNVPLTLTVTTLAATVNPVRWSLWGWYYAPAGS